MKILFLVPYPLKESPSQRFRFEQYFESLKRKGHTFEVSPFLDTKNWKKLYSGGNYFWKIASVTSGFFRRFLMLPRISQFDRVFIHREAAPAGPPLIEWIIARVFRRKIIFDFDDAIWLTDRQDEPGWLSIIKWRKKVASICRWSYKVSCGNNYLAEYARQFNTRAVYNPSTIDMERLAPARIAPDNQRITVGWTGSHSTLKYLKVLEPVLKEYQMRNPGCEMLVIADVPPDMNLPLLRFIRWSPQTEIEDLSQIDIGLMPLPDDEWSKGKCGFKALQYMSVGKPVLVSPIGANTQIVDDGVNGYFCTTSNDWLQNLQRLTDHEEARRLMGLNGSEKVLKHYSVTSNESNFLSLFE